MKLKISRKIISVAAITVALISSLGLTAMAASPSTSSNSSSAASSSAPGKDRSKCAHFGGDFVAYKALSNLTGISVNDLTTKYPQKTAWQIAKTLNKLDDLKKSFLSIQKTMLDKLAAEGKITADDSSKIYADLSKRVAAIDGTNTVILGRPGYRPQKSNS